MGLPRAAKFYYLLVTPSCAPDTIGNPLAQSPITNAHILCRSVALGERFRITSCHKQTTLILPACLSVPDRLLGTVERSRHHSTGVLMSVHPHGSSPLQTQVIHPYTDLLIHDMRPGLA